MDIGWIFSIAIASSVWRRRVFGRGSSALDRASHVRRRRCASAAGSSCRRSAFHSHPLWIRSPAYGVLGGSGLGIGDIPPVSTLIKWFPDRPGMATGMAIMGFGGGALIAAPLSVILMKHFKTALRTGCSRPSSPWASSTSCS